MGKEGSRSKDFNWEELNLDVRDLHDLEVPLTKEEVREAINQMPNGKAPVPNRFIGTFFLKCWGLVKVEVMRSIQILPYIASQAKTLSSGGAQTFQTVSSMGDRVAPKDCAS